MSRARAVGLAGLAALVLAGTPAATTGASADEAPVPQAGTAWFGPQVDWRTDSAAAYADRLGTDVSLLSRRIAYPLSRGSLRDLGALARAAGEGGAAAVVDLRPRGALDGLTGADAGQLATQLNRLHRATGAAFLVRFASGMNDVAVPWGQRPTAYVAAFRRLAARLDARAEAASTVWSPSYGGGYPFGGTLRGATLRDRAALDTDGDGRLVAGDDPYAPFYPGDDAVDWVGLTVLWDGTGAGGADRGVPGADALKDRLDDRSGYAGSAVRGTSFYTRYAAGAEQPMLLSTGAATDASAATSVQADVRTTWLRRVAVAVRSRPWIAGVLWLEDGRPPGGPVTWGLTSDPVVAGRALPLLAGDPWDLGPAAQGTPSDGVPEDAGGDAPGDAPGDAAGDAAGDGQDEAGTRSDAATRGAGAAAPRTAVVAGGLGGAAVLLAAGGVLHLRRRRRRWTRDPWL